MYDVPVHVPLEHTSPKLHAMPSSHALPERGLRKQPPASQPDVWQVVPDGQTFGAAAQTPMP